MGEYEVTPRSNTTDIFILLYRYGGNYWAPSGSYKTRADAEAATVPTNITGHRIIQIRDLPVLLPAGEV